MLNDEKTPHQFWDCHRLSFAHYWGLPDPWPLEETWDFLACCQAIRIRALTPASGTLNHMSLDSQDSTHQWELRQHGIDLKALFSLAQLIRSLESDVRVFVSPEIMRTQLLIPACRQSRPEVLPGLGFMPHAENALCGLSKRQLRTKSSILHSYKDLHRLVREVTWDPRVYCPPL